MRKTEYITTELDGEPGRAVVTFDFSQLTLSCMFIPDDRNKDTEPVFDSKTPSSAAGSLRFKRVVKEIKKDGL